MSVVISWSILEKAFGKDCVSNTKVGKLLSVKKINKKFSSQQQAEIFLSMGYKLETVYRKKYLHQHNKLYEYKAIELKGYDKEKNPLYKFGIYDNFENIWFCK